MNLTPEMKAQPDQALMHLVLDGADASPMERELAERMRRVWEQIHKHTDSIGRFVRGEPEHELFGALRSVGSIR